MKANIKVLFGSVAAGVAHIVYVQYSLAECDGFGCIANGLSVPFGIGVISIIFGIVGLFASKEKRIKQAFSWFGISFAVLILMNLAMAPLRRAEWNRTHPQLQNYDKNAPNYIGD